MNTPRKYSWVRAIFGLFMVATWALALAHWLSPGAFRSMGQSKELVLQELTVERINVIDADKRTRLVIANAQRFPDPVLRGETKERSIKSAAGIVLYDADGVETGGIASMTGPNGHHMAGTILDYTYQPTDGIGIMKYETADGSSWMAGLTIADRIPYKPGPAQTSEGVSRIMLANQNQNASLEIAGTDGKPRIRIGVAADNTAKIEVLDADGKVIGRLPNQ